MEVTGCYTSMRHAGRVIRIKPTLKWSGNVSAVPGSHLVVWRGAEIFRNWLWKSYRTWSLSLTPYQRPGDGSRFIASFLFLGLLSISRFVLGNKDWTEKRFYRQAQFSGHSGPISVPTTCPVFCPPTLWLLTKRPPQVLFKDILLCVKHCAICFSNLFNPSHAPGTQNCLILIRSAQVDTDHKMQIQDVTFVFFDCKIQASSLCLLWIFLSVYKRADTSFISDIKEQSMGSQRVRHDWATQQ